VFEFGMAEQRIIALALSYVTVGYNILEGLVSLVFASLRDSPALLGFGIDSVMESLSGMVMIWRFSSPVHDERREGRAIWLVGVSLIVLGAYVAWEAAKALYYGEPPERSVAGLIIAALSLVVMPLLYVLKRRTANRLRSRSLATDAKQTLACLLLSCALLAGSGLNYTIGWWHADPLAALLIAIFLMREGYEAWSEKEWCC